MPDLTKPFCPFCGIDSDKLLFLISYLYDDEKKHWEEEGQPPDHIFTIIEEFKQILAG